GQARICRVGRDVTVVTYGRTVPVAVQAAEGLAGEGIAVEVIDLRSLCPYDWDAVVTSVKKTRRVCFLNEDTEVTNFGEHLLRRTVEELFYELEAPPRLIAGAHVPGVGLADPLERASVPQIDQVTAILKEIARHEP
ncbi:MAG: transketolase C-terminal domain-containing protein, partial [Polyangiaceae bacterium]